MTLLKLCIKVNVNVKLVTPPALKIEFKFMRKINRLFCVGQLRTFTYDHVKKIGHLTWEFKKVSS